MKKLQIVLEEIRDVLRRKENEKKKRKKKRGHSRFPLFNIEKWKDGWHIFHSISQFLSWKKKKEKALIFFNLIVINFHHILNIP